MYQERDATTRVSAAKILAVVEREFGPIDSAVDVGCGVGTFLSVLRETGVKVTHGIDGPWVDKDLLEISVLDFEEVNLESPRPLDRKYDLAICLEVAEHLSSSSAEIIVAFLVECSNLVLFSAAIPEQGGEGHQNEQWQSYWVQMFNERGYVARDAVRPEIWNDPDVLYWYKQNTLVFVRGKDGVSLSETKNWIVDVVHPDAYLAKLASRRRRLAALIPEGSLKQFALRMRRRMSHG